MSSHLSAISAEALRLLRHGQPVPFELFTRLSWISGKTDGLPSHSQFPSQKMCVFAARKQWTWRISHTFLKCSGRDLTCWIEFAASGPNCRRMTLHYGEFADQTVQTLRHPKGAGRRSNTRLAEKMANEIRDGSAILLWKQPYSLTAACIAHVRQSTQPGTIVASQKCVPAVGAMLSTCFRA